uniref:Uncharacterized protein n=1 Tax=Avena sativa TaxID=4498 RepID=A0ACD5WSP1_AVESA
MDGGNGGVAQLARQLADCRLSDELGQGEMEYVRRFHRREPADNQCTSVVIKHIKAPVQIVWSLVRRFDQPQLFKRYIRECLMHGNIETGSVREVSVQTGFPATRSTERLEMLDDNERIISVKLVGGDHVLKNYLSILTVHPEVIDGHPGTLVIESFVVDVPKENTKDEICYFVKTLLNWNLGSLADVSEERVKHPTLN